MMQLIFNENKPKSKKKIKTKVEHKSTISNEEELFPPLVLNPSDNNETIVLKKDININIIKKKNKNVNNRRKLF